MDGPPGDRPRRGGGGVPRAPREGARPVVRTRSTPTARPRDVPRVLRRPLRRGQWDWGTVDRLALRGFLGGIAAARARRSDRPRGRSRRADRCTATCRSTTASPTGSPGPPDAEARQAAAELPRPGTDRGAVRASRRRGGEPTSSRPVRDLAMLELFYSSGLRLSELQGLNLATLDLLSDQVKVRGKGKEGTDRSGGPRAEPGPAPLS